MHIALLPLLCSSYARLDSLDEFPEVWSLGMDQQETPTLGSGLLAPGIVCLTQALSLFSSSEHLLFTSGFLDPLLYHNLSLGPTIFGLSGETRETVASM